jgi:hypothetical protein
VSRPRHRRFGVAGLGFGRVPVGDGQIAVVDGSGKVDARPGYCCRRLRAFDGGAPKVIALARSMATGRQAARRDRIGP